MRKKMLLVASVALIALLLTGCMSSGAAVPELTVNEGQADPSATEFDDNLDGLIQYLTGCQVIVGDGMDMSADFIGAVAGKKFGFRNGEASASCELYEFDLQNLNETASSALSAIKEKGFLPVLDKEVKAQINDSGKFIMIYVNSKNDDSQKAYSDKLHEKFISFKGK